MKEEMGMVRLSEVGRSLIETQEGDLQLVYKEIDVPADLLYTIGRGSAGMLASMYDLISREMGIKFSVPKVLEETEDRVRVEVSCAFRGTFGGIVEDGEVYTIDVRKLYELSRLKWMPMVWSKDEHRKVVDEKEVEALKRRGYLLDEAVYDEDSIPVKMKRKLPPEVETELWTNFLTLKSNKMSKAITCAHRRLAQRALGVKGIKYDPNDKTWKDKVKLQIYAFAPKMKEQEIGDIVEGIYEENESSQILHEQAAERRGTAPVASATPAPPSSPPKKAPPVPAASPAAKEPSSDTCVDCGVVVKSAKVREFSTSKLGAVVCMDCQKARKEGKPNGAAPVAEGFEDADAPPPEEPAEDW